MSINDPTNTIILITEGVIGIGIVIWLVLSEVLSQLPFDPHVKRNWRWGSALVLGAWLIARLALEVNPPGGGVIGAGGTIGFVVFGLMVGTLPLLFSSSYRQIVRAMPATLIIGLQIVRAIGGLFLVLLDMKLLPANFALPAGYGDVAVAVLAPVVVYLMVKKSRYARAAAIAWNLLGMLDLIVALTTGATYIPSFASQLAATGVSVLYLNYVLIIPAYGVPLAFVFHIYSLYKLLSRRVDLTEPGVEAPVQSSAFAK